MLSLVLILGYEEIVEPVVYFLPQPCGWKFFQSRTIYSVIVNSSLTIPASCTARWLSRISEAGCEVLVNLMALHSYLNMGSIPILPLLFALTLFLVIGGTFMIIQSITCNKKYVDLDLRKIFLNSPLYPILQKRSSFDLTQFKSELLSTFTWLKKRSKAHNGVKGSNLIHSDGREWI